METGLIVRIQRGRARYKHSGWQGYGHFLGTGNVPGFGTGYGQGNTVKLVFEEALVFARNLKLGSRDDWRAWSKSGSRPANIPPHPDSSYKTEGWQGWPHWLGETFANKSRSNVVVLTFDEALPVARALNLPTQAAWWAYAKSNKRPKCIPFNPHILYKEDGWLGYRHWLGPRTDKPKKPKKTWSRKPKAPGTCSDQQTATAESQSAGTPTLVPTPTPVSVLAIKQDFRPFNEALVFARSLGLRGIKEWKEWSKTGVRPADIPGNPLIAYEHDGWQGWVHWLGAAAAEAATSTNCDGLRDSASPSKGFLPFDEALVYARSLSLKGIKEWKEWSKTKMRPSNMPGNPHVTYKRGGWQGYGHWLRTQTVGTRKPFMTFDKALSYARSLGLQDMREWQAWSKSSARPANMPTNPYRAYVLLRDVLL